MRNDKYRTFLVLFLLAVGLPVQASAQPDAAVIEGDDSVDRAEIALKGANFEDLTEILENTVTDGETNRPARAHLLYALGLYYEARADDDEALVAQADGHIKQALTIDPGLELDPQVYPPRFINRVTEVRQQALPELDSAADPPQVEHFYFERYVETRSRLPLFLPGGIGQFYNGSTFRGITFLTVQLLGLATNAAGYWKVESMRTSSGTIEAQDLNRANAWRRAQMAGIATFAAGWLFGSLEANLGFERKRVRVRTLDSPPPEFSQLPGHDLGLGSALQLQWTAIF